MATVVDRKHPFKTSLSSKFLLLGLFAYLFYAFSTLDFGWNRFVLGLDQGARLVDRLFPPNFARWELLLSVLIESLLIAIIASVLGIVISLFVGLMAARNLMPNAISIPVRVFIALCRTFHPVIIAILFVKAVGFGAMAGILTLTVASIGFVAKLFAEAIEEISFKPVESLRATGAGFISTLVFGVTPTGFFAVYRFFHLSIRLEPTQLHHDRYRWCRGVRWHTVFCLPTFRL